MGRSMTPRRQIAAAAVLAAAVAMSGCAGHRHMPIFRTPPVADVVLQTWLAKSCKAGDDNELEGYMRKFGTQITANLIAAFTAGPPDSERQMVYRAAESQLAEVKQRMSAVRLRQEDADLVQQLDPGAYSKKAVEDRVRAYRSSALAGLGVVGTPEARARLAQEAADAQSEYQALASLILAQGTKTPKMPKRQ
jgi:hypothetical protein